jgi:hypothetical protein
MSEEPEQQEPTVTDVPEPDQEPHEPIPDEADQQAEEEAAEAEQPAEEPSEAPEAQGPTPEQIEKVWKATDKAVNAYVKKIGEIWEESGLSLTPFGLDPAAPLGFVNMDNAGRVDEETKGAALQFLGFAREQDYAADPETSTCRTCQGKGKTKTGSLVAGNESRTCRSCDGYGYTPPPSTSENGVAGTVDLHAPAGERVEALSTGFVDNWGEPQFLPDGRQNPNYGKMPDHKVPVEPWGITRNLTAQDAQV